MLQLRKIATIALVLSIELTGASPPLAASPISQGPGIDWQGKPVSLDRLKDKVTVVIASSNATKDVGAVVDQALMSAFGDNPRFQLIRVVNLIGVPTFAEDIVVDTIKERDAAEVERIKAEYTASGRTYQQQADTFFILDWEGKLRQALLATSPRPEYAPFKNLPRRTSTRFKSPEQKERENLDNHLHVFLLDSNGEVKAHYLDAAAVEQTLNDVRSQLTPPAPLPPVPATNSTPGGLSQSPGLLDKS